MRGRGGNTLARLIEEIQSFNFILNKVREYKHYPQIKPINHPLKKKKKKKKLLNNKFIFNLLSF